MAKNNNNNQIIHEAKRIANRHYEDITEEYTNEDGLKCVAHINIAFQIEGDITAVLEKHPDFDEDKFRGLIKRFQQENKNKQREFINESL